MLVDGPRTRVPPIVRRPNGQAASGASKGKGKGVHDGEDADIVARTELLTLNGDTQHTVNGVGHALAGSSAGGKGKGKAVVRPEPEVDGMDSHMGFGDATNGDDGLYE